MSPARAILFGKLPRHGDFVARGLGGAERGAWDDWASHGLEDARAALGDTFEARHDAAPPWRFVGAPGPFGPGWRAGAMAPSIDSAGRRFVILLAAENLAADEAGASGETLAESMEDLIYQAFESGWDADTLAQAASPLPAVTAGETAPQARWWTLGGPEHPPASLEGQPADLILRMLAPATGEAQSGENWP